MICKSQVVHTTYTILGTTKSTWNRTIEMNDFKFKIHIQRHETIDVTLNKTK